MHVRYMMTKLSGSNLEKEKLASVLEQILLEGGTVELLLDKNEKSDWNYGNEKSLHQFKIDNSYDFKFQLNGYKLNVVCYLIPVTGRAEIVQLFCLADDGADHYGFAFTMFRNSFKSDPPVILVDKDVNEILSLQKLFPNSVILLCHTMWIFDEDPYLMEEFKITANDQGMIRE